MAGFDVPKVFRREAGCPRPNGSEADQVRFRRADGGARGTQHPPHGNRGSGSVLARPRAATAAQGRPHGRWHRGARSSSSWQCSRRKGGAQAASNLAAARRSSPLRSNRSFPQRRRERNRFRGFGRRDRRRRFDPCLWRASRPSHGRCDRQLAGTHLLQQDRSRASRHRRPVQDCRRHRSGPSRPADPGLARRRHDTGGGTRLKQRVTEMGRVVVVTSGKGGVGKTTSTAALGAALARTGQAVVVIDFDMGLRNLDLVMGAELRVVYDFVDVIQGAAKLPQALIRDKRIETLFLLPASQTRDKDALTEDGVARVIEELRPKFDWVICDSPAGIERGATLAMRHADAAVVVTNPEVSSVHDSHRIIGLLDAKTEKAEKGERIEKHLLLTRYDAARAARGEMLAIEDVLEILSTPLLGIIPESEEVLRASNFGSPITLHPSQTAENRGCFAETGNLGLAQDCVVGPGDGVSGLVAAVSGPLGDCASD